MHRSARKNLAMLIMEVCRPGPLVASSSSHRLNFKTDAIADKHSPGRGHYMLGCTRQVRADTGTCAGVILEVMSCDHARSGHSVLEIP